MKQYLAYTRVSTTKQGERGSSLQEQRASIEQYAKRNNLAVSKWFEEQETAAKRGRRLFTQMLAELNRGEAQGVIIHKIDRSARNLRDWAELGELIDRGIDVHFAHDSLDLSSRGGRLSADIQAVVAADFIRNLRDEVRKGFYGRLKQGLYPLPAPVGYRDEGAGRAKSVDAIAAPFVKLAFVLYGGGKHNLLSLSEELYKRGFRSKHGKRVGNNRLSEILNNSFYIGIIHIRRTGESFQGIHQPIVTAALFERVQDVLQGRTRHRNMLHDFLYRKSVKCADCSRSLVGEAQKGHVYYRCHSQSCKGKSVREEVVALEIAKGLQRITLNEEELVEYGENFTDYANAIAGNATHEKESLRLKLAALDGRLERTTDAYVDRLIDKDVFEERKATILKERASFRDNLEDAEAGRDWKAIRLAYMFELFKSLQTQGDLAEPAEKLDWLKSVSSNLSWDGKTLGIAWDALMNVVAFREYSNDGGPSGRTGRTECPHDTLPLHHVKGGLICKLLRTNDA